MHQPRVRTKICGIRHPEDALAAAQAGADAIGLVFYDDSPRGVSLAEASAIAEVLPAFVSIVALFVDPEPERVRDVLSKIPVDIAQFHGSESPAFCASFGRRWLKAIRVRSAADVEAAFETYSQSSGLLVDAYDSERVGGTGKTFDWTLLPAHRPVPLILAGGLNSANVATAITAVRPWGVDVSGGVESSRGVKDSNRIIEFLNEVNRVG